MPQPTWRKGDAPPVLDLPFREIDAEGHTWTDLANNLRGRQACGWGPGPEVPDFDPATHQAVWNAELDAFEILDLPPAAEPRIVTVREYMDRLTDMELVTIETAAGVDPAIRVQLRYLYAGPTVDLDSAKLIAALDYMVAQGHLAAGRPAEIRA